MVAVLRWWLALTALGWLAWPLARAVWPQSAGGGHAWARPLGLIVLGYAYWLLGMAGLIPHSAPALWGVTAALALAGLLAWVFCRRQMAQVLRADWRQILTAELLFALVLLLCAAQRGYDPGIRHTEQPMDFALLNGILRSPTLPPRDPWLAGQSISYYYGGYWLVALLTWLTNLPAGVGYNLGLVHTMALAMTAAYGLLSALLPRRAGRWAAGAALGALTLLFVGNGEVLFELLRARGLGGEGFFRWQAVPGLADAVPNGGWLPTEGWWWWRASRVFQDANWLGRLPTVITEFPAFSFVLGDLHPHLLALPFLLTGLALPLAWWPAPAGRTRGRPALAVAPLILGWLGFTNSWDLPTIGLIVAAAWAAGLWRAGRTRRRGAWLAAGLAWLIGGSLLLYLPFYRDLQSQVQGIGAVYYAKTRLPSYAIVWAPWLLPIGVELWQRGKRLAWRPLVRLWAALALLPWLAMLLVSGWGALLWGLLPLAGAGPWLWLLLSGALSVLLLDLHHRLVAEPFDSSGALWGFFCLVGLGLTYAIEFLYVRDLFDTRMNTVFKCAYQAWTLLGLCGLVALGRQWRAGGGQRWGAAAALVILLGCGVYGPAAATTQAGGYRGAFTLDGTAFLATESPDTYGAFRWLQANTSPQDVLVEAPGEPYHAWTSRLSGWTGVPTVLGWPGHEVQWRGDRQLVAAREREVDAFYRSFGPAETAALRAHGATLVLLGPNERERYGVLPAVPGWETAYASASVTLYRLP